MKKILFVIWSANKGVFTHIMMNTLDLAAKQYEVGIVFESEGCKLVKDYEDHQNDKFDKIKEQGLIASVCKVCAQAMGTLESAEKQDLPIHDDLWGHTPLEKWIANGYDIVSV